MPDTAAEVFEHLIRAIQQIQKTQEKLLSRSSESNQADVRGIQLQQYDETNESFDTYLQRIQNYLELRNITDDTPENDKKAVQILISCLGPKLYHTLTSLTAPALPREKSFKELKSLLEDHLCPKPSEVAEQHKFSSRIQHEGETISNFQADLKKLTTNCNFICGDCKKSTINTHLRSQFIRGIRDSDIRERLLQQSPKTFEDAVKIALTIESSKLESRGMQQPQQINYVGTTRKQKKKNEDKAKTSIKEMLGKCFRCGKTNHKANQCTAKNLKCYNCRKEGHLQSVCLKKSYEQKQITQDSPEENKDVDDDDEEEHLINSIEQVNKKSTDKFLVRVKIDDVDCQMELDTGAAVSTMSKDTFDRLCLKKNLHHTDVKLKTYSGEIMHPLGTCNVTIKYKNKSTSGNLYVLQEKVDTILGRDWLRKINFDLAEIYKFEITDMSEDTCKLEISKLISQFHDIFSEEVGKIPNYKCSFKLKDDRSTPIYMKPRPVPYALKDKIDAEIDRLEQMDIIEKVVHSDWGTPVVPVVKRNGQIRLCADYKATLNKFIQDDNYPIPKVEDIFAKMSDGKYFCTLDIHQAYLHMEVDEEAALLQTISTHKGLYKVKRLMFGVKVAPNSWQRFMDQILHDLPGVSCFFDDITVQGRTYNELLLHLKAIFSRLRHHGLHLNKNKCQFLLRSINYLGHVIDQNGLHPMPEKVEAILKSPQPRDISELRTFLGLVNYYHKFLPNLASKLKPLNNLLRKNEKYKWSRDCETVFQNLKKEIASKKILTPFDVNLPLTLATDASPTGLGAVISHIMKDGSERPIAFASRSLTKSEANYSQIDKEATAIVWALKKFFQYCYGRKFTLITDNKPLTRIFHPNKDLPATSATRLLHYANFMSGFNYNICYRNTKEHANADYLSRFSLLNTQQENDYLDSSSIFQLNQIDTLPVTRKEIQKETLNDPECRKIYEALKSGNELAEDDLHNYSIQNGCILKGIRVIIPQSLRKRILEELHSAHTGIVRMKALARSYVYWKRIDNDIEEITRNCKGCSAFRSEPRKVPIHPWEYPKYPWQRLHIDYAGPFMNTYFLLVVDAYTKWVETIPTNRICTQSTIRILRDIFSRFGLPITIVSDNGTQFRSSEFEEFLKSNGIQHKFCAPYHPASNGQVERYVQTIKQGLRSMMFEKGDLNTKLNRLLMQYRKVPNTVTGVSPAELMFKREFRTRIDLVKRDLTQELNEQNKLINPTIREYQIGDSVQARFYNNKCCKWKFGIITDKKGYLHYEVLIENNKYIRHIDQLRASNVKQDGDKNILIETIPVEPLKMSTDTEINVEQSVPGNSKNETKPSIQDLPENKTSSPTRQSIATREEVPGVEEFRLTSPELRRSTRIRKAPVRLQLT